MNSTQQKTTQIKNKYDDRLDRVYGKYAKQYREKVNDNYPAVRDMLMSNPDYYAYIISRCTQMLCAHESTCLAISIFNPKYKVHPQFLKDGYIKLTVQTNLLGEGDGDYDWDDILEIDLLFYEKHDEGQTPPNVEELIYQFTRLRGLMLTGEYTVVKLDMVYYPCFRALLDMDGRFRSVDIDPRTLPAQAMQGFSRLRELDMERSRRSGDTPNNPSPNYIFPESHLQHRFLYTPEPPEINAHSLVHRDVTFKGVALNGPLIGGLIHHILRSPSPVSFIKYQHLGVQDIAPVKLRSHKTQTVCNVPVPAQDVTKYGKGPVSVNITPLEQALTILVNSGSDETGVWSIPVYMRGPKFTSYYKFVHVYKRRDGKLININIFMCDYGKNPPNFGYVSVTDLKLMLSEYMSLCVTRYFSLVLENALVSGDRSMIKTYFMSMFMNNSLIRSSLDSCSNNYFDVYLYAPQVNFSLASLIPPIINFHMDAYESILKAPIRVSEFAKWIRINKWHNKISKLDLSPIRFSEYGFGGLLSFGTFDHVSSDHFSVYNRKKHSFEVTNDHSKVYLDDLHIMYVSSVILQILLRELTPARDIGDVEIHVRERASNAELYAITHVYKQCLLLGVNKKHHEFFKARVPLCATCMTNLKAWDQTNISHCTANNKAYKQFNRELVVFEGVFNYWFQKVVGMNVPTWNSFLYYCGIEHLYVSIINRVFVLKVEQGTMLSGFANKIGTNIAAPIVQQVTDQLNQTQKLIDSVSDKKLVTRVDNVVERLERILPFGQEDTTSGISGFIDIIDKYVQEKIYSAIKMIFPLYHPSHMPKISLSKIVRDYVLMKHVDNVTIKGFLIVDMLSNAGLFESVKRFFTGFQLVCKNNDGTAWSDLPDWISFLVSKPMEWIKYVGGFISGYVATLVDKLDVINPKHLLQYIASVAPTFRNVSGIGSGLNALGTIFTFVSKAYYLAKEYVYKLLGKTCSVPMFVHLKEHLGNWSGAVATLLLPEHRNTLLNSAETWSLIDNIYEVGLQLLVEAKNTALNNTMSGLMRDLTKLRMQISTKRGIRQTTFVPFVIHLNGPVNIGKSTIWQNVVDTLSDIMGISREVYMYNETLKYMDGYAGQEILVCDDVNLTKDADSCVWLIKVVAPNLCFLPTAVNEERPLISNIKIVILTSNTAYSPCSEVATTKGIDRRSRYKFNISAKHYDAKASKIPDEAKKQPDFDWTTEHEFVRIPSVEGDILSQEEEFTGDQKGWLKFVCTAALKHTEDEKARILAAPEGNFIPPPKMELQEKLFDGLSAGSASIDLSVIRDTLSKIKFITPETFLQGSTPTIEPAVERQLQLVIERNISRGSTERLQNHNMYPNRARAMVSYPTFSNDRIVFTGKYIEPKVEDVLVTEPLYKRYFGYKGENFDFFFLHQLEHDDKSWFIRKSYKRLDFVSGNISVMPQEVTFDYTAYASLLIDSSFMDSWLKFFSHSEHMRMCIYEAYRNRITTTANMLRHTNTWGTKIKRFFQSLFSQDTLMRIAISSFIGLTSIASVGVAYETMASMLRLNMTQAYSDAYMTQFETSQPGKAHKETKTAVQTRLTSLKTDHCYDDVRAKVSNNLFLARINNYMGQTVGTFNILFISERFALINHHVLAGLQPEFHASDNNMIAIRIFIPKKDRFEKFYFSRNYYRFKDKDACLIHIPAFQAQSNIMRVWMKEEISDQCFGSPTEILFKTLNGDSERYESQHGKFNQKNDCVIIANRAQTPIEYKDLYCIECVVPQGSSGGFGILNNTRYQTKVFGIQSSSGENSHVQLILCCELEKAIEFYHDQSIIKYRVDGGVPTCDVPYTPAYDLEVPSLIGVVDKEHAVTISPKTQLKKTPYYGVFIDPPQKTPVLSRVSKEDRYIYTNKTEKTSPIAFDQQELDEVVTEYVQYLKDVIRLNYGKYRPIGVLSLDAVLNGTYTGGKSIDLTTSPGIGLGDWIHNRKLKGSHDFVRREGDRYIPEEILQDAVRKELSRQMAGDPSTCSYASFPKDELRNKDARGIDGAPIEQKLIYKMLFGLLDGMLSHANDGKLRYGLGIDLFSTSGVNLMSRITPLVMMWDFSNYDGSITYQMYQAVVNIYNQLSDNDEFSVARHTLAYKTCYSTIIADDKVYQPLKGMRSGFGGTSSFNTHIHNLYLILAIKQIIKETIHLHPTIYDVFDMVDWITYGDDGLAWLKNPEMADKINGESISQKFIDFGLLVTDPRGKTTLPPKFVTIEEATFLKQSPYFDSALNVPVWRVNEECLSSVFSYYSGDDPFEALDCAFRMLWPYGRERYESYRKQLNAVLVKHNRVYCQEWLTLQQIFLENFHGACYTGKIFKVGSSNHNMILD